MSSLASKFQRVKSRLLGTAAVDIPTPFELTCECGQRIAGIRKATSQQAECTLCGTVRFVLPVNVYPSTRRVGSEVTGGGMSDRLAAAAKELVPVAETVTPVDSAVPASSPGARDLPGTSADRRDKAGSRERDKADSREREKAGSRKEVRPATAEAEQPARAAIQPVDIKRVARRTFTPFRLLMASALAVVVVTGWYSIRQKRMADARQNWRTSVDAIELALQEQNFDDLQQPLDVAVQAAALLGKRDPETRRMINLMYQTTAINQVSTVDLVAELQRVYLKSGQLDESRVTDLKNVITLGTQFFDCPLTLVDGSDTKVRLNLPLRIGAHSVIIESRSSLLRQAAAKLQGTSIVFAAKIAACRSPLDADSDGSWSIELASEGCALLTSGLHCTQIGLDAETQPLLKQQLQRQEELIETIDLQALQQQDQQLQMAREQQAEQSGEAE